MRFTATINPLPNSVGSGGTATGCLNTAATGFTVQGDVVIALQVRTHIDASEVGSDA